MFECHVCGNKTSREELVSEVFNIDGRRVLVEKIPAQICERCGEAEFSPDIAEKVRRLVNETGQPKRTETLDVFALS